MTLGVSELNNQIKSLLESTFLHVSVEGEVSRITYHSSGHLYFTLKDKNSSISCVMFRGNNMKMQFRLEEGMAVLVHGSVSVYSPRGSYQINTTKIEPAGQGALHLAYEQLKKRLKEQGYFDKKQQIPSFIKHIAIVTSQTGAALQDMLRVAKKRWPLVKITLIDTVVQGKGCQEGIAKNLQRADSLGVDVIILSRGGGSLEDLWGFNEECVAKAIYEARTPVVSAVGHEIDYVISDFVADLRAPTPSAAMEMILPDKVEMLFRIDEMINQGDLSVKRFLHNKKESLNYLWKLLQTYSFEARIKSHEKEIEGLKERFSQKVENLISTKSQGVFQKKEYLDFALKRLLQNRENSMQTLMGKYAGSDPSLGLKEGYAQLVKDKKRVNVADLHEGESVELHTREYIFGAEILSKSKIK